MDLLIPFVFFIILYFIIRSDNEKARKIEVVLQKRVHTRCYGGGFYTHLHSGAIHDGKLRYVFLSMTKSGVKVCCHLNSITKSITHEECVDHTTHFAYGLRDGRDFIMIMSPSLDLYEIVVLPKPWVQMWSKSPQLDKDFFMPIGKSDHIDMVPCELMMEEPLSMDSKTCEEMREVFYETYTPAYNDFNVEIVE